MDTDPTTNSTLPTKRLVGLFDLTQLDWDDDAAVDQLVDLVTDQIMDGVRRRGEGQSKVDRD